MDKIILKNKEGTNNDNYDDIFKKHVQQYKKLLDDNIITEEEYNKIIQNVKLNLKEDSKITNIEPESNKFFKYFKKTIYFIMQGFKYYFSVIMLASAYIATPYHLHTIIFLICGIILFPNIQRKISQKYNKDKKFELYLSIITFFTYCLVLLICIYSFDNVKDSFFYVSNKNISASETSNTQINTKNEAYTETEKSSQIEKKIKPIVLEHEEYLKKLKQYINDFNKNNYTGITAIDSFYAGGGTMKIYIFTEHTEYNEEAKRILEDYSNYLYENCKYIQYKKEGLFGLSDIGIYINIGYQNDKAPNTAYVHFSTLCKSRIDCGYLRKNKPKEEVIKYTIY